MKLIFFIFLVSKISQKVLKYQSDSINQKFKQIQNSVLNKLQKSKPIDPFPSVNIDNIFNILDKKKKNKINPKFWQEPKNLKDKFKAIDKDLQRKLNLGLLVDTIQVPDYDMMTTQMPFFVPQVQDSRIRIQTFNPPPKPITPGLLPNPHYNVQLQLPKKEDDPVVTKEVNIFSQKKLNSEVTKIVKRAFYKALNKMGMGKYREGNGKIFRLNIFDNQTDRVINNEQLRTRIQNVNEKISRLFLEYQEFYQGITHRLTQLESYKEKLNTYKRIIV